MRTCTVQSGVTEVEFTSYSKAISYAAKVSRNNGSAAIIDDEFVVAYVNGKYVLTAFLRDSNPNKHAYGI